MTAATTNSYLKIISMITAASEHNVGSITEKREMSIVNGMNTLSSVVVC